MPKPIAEESINDAGGGGDGGTGHPLVERSLIPIFTLFKIISNLLKGLNARQETLKL
jgi:hypothetical protein